jgi:hypothetical protein
MKLRPLILPGIALAMLVGMYDQLPVGYDSLDAVLATPERFREAEVRVRGEVLNVSETPGFRGYYLQDKKGEIVVLSAGVLPKVKDRVGLTGKLQRVARQEGAKADQMWMLEEKKRWRLW